MRVITGLARGRKLVTLEGEDVRPTTDMVKEAIFSVIQFDIEGSVVLDLFSGSGQLGIEALSRGAKYCRFVDKSQASAEITRQNVTACGFVRDSAVSVMDSIDFVRGVRMTFDIAFLDLRTGTVLSGKRSLFWKAKCPTGALLSASMKRVWCFPTMWVSLKRKRPTDTAR